MAGESARAVEVTGITYHEDMINHYCLWDSNHPECPKRFAGIIKRCETLNLLDRCKYIPPREAQPEEILRKHSEDLITLLKDCQTKTADELEEISSRYDSIYICSETYRLAMLAAGSTIDLVKAVCNDDVKNGMAIVRPPGHHAMTSEYCGFCYFNNVALSADYALRTHNLSRILIVDWDVHHGQATQRFFYNDPRVLYFSIHRFEHGTFWPNLRESNSDHIGEGAGEGFNFNVPLNKTALGDADYITIFHQILLPVAVEYQPELIIVSAGFDPAIGCPEGEMVVTPACFAHFVNSLSHLASGKIAVVLEGGYFIPSLSEGAALSLRALLGDPCPDIGRLGEIDESTRETILNVIYSHKNFWNCFKMHSTYPPSQDLSTDTDCFRPVFKFEHVEQPIEKYPTRDCYPSRPEETEKFYSSWVDELIKDTKLFEVKYRCCNFSSTFSKNYELIRSLQHPKSKFVDVAGSTDLEQILSLILDPIVKNDTSSIIFDVNSLKSKSHDSILENILIGLAADKFQFKRIINIDLTSRTECSKFEVNSDNTVLHFSFIGGLNADLQGQENDFLIRFPWNAESAGDNEFLTAWFKLLLPISYQFDPELIVITVSFGEGSKLSPALYAYLVHWLTSLANGRVILVADFDSGNQRELQSFLYCHKALLGSPVPVLPRTDRPILSTAVKDLKILAQRLSSRWTNLNFFVKFPEDTTK